NHARHRGASNGIAAVSTVKVIEAKLFRVPKLLVQSLALGITGAIEQRVDVTHPLAVDAGVRGELFIFAFVHGFLRQRERTNMPVDCGSDNSVSAYTAASRRSGDFFAVDGTYSINWFSTS